MALVDCFKICQGRRGKLEVSEEVCNGLKITPHLLSLKAEKADFSSRFPLKAQERVLKHRNKQHRTFLNPPIPCLGPQGTAVCYCLSPLQLLKCRPTADYCKSLINYIPHPQDLRLLVPVNSGSVELWGHLVHTMRRTTSFYKAYTRAELCTQ